jgi:hypothetical protein
MYDKNQPPLYILARIAAILRAENGCPWDREQTHDHTEIIPGGRDLRALRRD